MTTPAIAIYPAATAERLSEPKGIVRLIAQMIGAQLRYHRTLSELSRLDDRALDDIGVSRDELASLARRHARGLPPRIGTGS